MRLVVAAVVGIFALVLSASPSSAGPICVDVTLPLVGTISVCIPGTG